MALNSKFANGRKLSLPVPAGVVSGEPVVVGALPGVAQTDRDAAGNASVDTGGAYDLSVTGTGAAAAATAIAAGAIIYITAARALNVDPGGTRYGYALEAVAAGATAVIAVKVGY